MIRVNFDPLDYPPNIEPKMKFESRDQLVIWLKENWQSFPFIDIKEKEFSYMSMKTHNRIIVPIKRS